MKDCDERSTKAPMTEDEWRTKAINIHGVFFEHWCRSAIHAAPGWITKTAGYPVEFPPPNGPIRGEESCLDIRADYMSGDCILTLLIECKKNNPEFVDWVFFPTSNQPSNIVIVTALENQLCREPGAGWKPQTVLMPTALDAVVAWEARETRSNHDQYTKRDKTKTSNNAVSDAAFQITLATQAIALEEARFQEVSVIRSGIHSLQLQVRTSRASSTGPRHLDRS
jgi:hypothetical protein